MATSAGVPCILAAILGHASWIFYFHRFECHMYGVLYINTFLLSCGGGFLALNRIYGLGVGDAAGLTSAIAASFLGGLYGSLLVWRAFFNPLNKFPGPWPARLGNLYFSFNLANSDAYYKLQAMHKKWGKIVRIGSNDLSITDPKIMETAYGRNSEVTKSWWYDNDYPLSSMHTTRDRERHDKRRKVWVPAFSEKAIRDYETRITGLEELLVTKIADHKDKPVDVKVYFNLFSFDVMALLAFGKNYGMLEKGEKHWALDLLDEGMQPLAYFLPTWLFRLLIAIPGLAGGFHKFVQFCVDELTWRVNNANEADSKGGSDIMSWILRAYEGVDRPEKDPMLRADSRLIIVAGSDTTAATFTFLFYYLAKYPEQVKKLREELKPLMSGNWSDKDINQAQHLNGCIWEALRLHPPVPSGVQRLTPPQGMEVDGRHVPGNTVFYMPQYVMARGKSLTSLNTSSC
jgi:tryprostatin B 6-hydroxylase